MENIRVRVAPGVPQTGIKLPIPLSLSGNESYQQPDIPTTDKKEYAIEGLPLQSALWTQNRKALDVQKRSIVYNNLSVVTDKYGGDIMAFQRSEDGKKFMNSIVELEKGYLQSDLNKGIIEEQKKFYDKLSQETMASDAMTTIAMNQRNQYLYYDEQGNIKADTYINPQRAYMTMGDYLQSALMAGYKGGAPEMLPMVDVAPTGEFDKFLNTMVDRVRGSVQEFITSETKEGKPTGYKFSQSSNARAINVLNAVVFDQLVTNPKALREAKSQYYSSTGGTFLEGKVNPETKKPFTDDEKFRRWVTSMAAERAELERTYNISIVEKPTEAQRTMEYIGGLNEQTYASGMMDKNALIALSQGRKANVNLPRFENGQVVMRQFPTPITRHATPYINRENTRITTYDSKGKATYTQDAKMSPYIMSAIDAMGNVLSRQDLMKIPGDIRIKQLTDEIYYLPRMKTSDETGMDMPIADEGNLIPYRKVILISNREFMRNYPTYFANKRGRLELGTPAYTFGKGGIQEDFIRDILGGSIIDKDNDDALEGDRSFAYPVLVPENIVNAAPNILSDVANKETTEYLNAIYNFEAKNNWINDLSNQYVQELLKYKVNGRR